MMSRRVVLFGAVVVGVSYVLAIEHASPEATRAGSGDASAPQEAEERAPLQAAGVASLHDKREVSRLAADLARMKNEIDTLRDDAEQERAATDRAAPAPKTAEQLQAEHDEYMAAVERAFDQQPRDERWAQGTAQRVRETLESEPIMLAALRGIECRSSACRLELRDDGSTAFAQELPLMMHNMGAVLPEVRFGHAELSDGARLHVMYMSQSSVASAAER